MSMLQYFKKILTAEKPETHHLTDGQKNKIAVEDLD